MHSPSPVSASEVSDAELVQASRAGNRDAFGCIVRKYQSLVCSVTYSATGSIARSEDLAQETFFTAWRELGRLRQPAHLRAWICGIARNLTHSALRREQRQPVQLAGSREPSADIPAPDPLPADQAISREEEAILWRALAALPETYREPLVLFYREHQSIEAVAAALELSEDAVKQRLSRGRVLLQAQVLALVEGALERTKPGAAFTCHVMTALPCVATGGAALTTGAAMQGSGAAKSGAIAIASATIFRGLVAFFTLVGAIVFLGGCMGYLMNCASRRSAAQREHVLRYWRTIAWAFAVFVVPGTLALLVLGEHRVTSALMNWLALIHAIVPLATAGWLWRWERGLRRSHDESRGVAAGASRRFAVWLAGGLLVPALFFGSFFVQVLVHPTLGAARIAESEARQLIAGRSDASFTLRVYHGEPRTLEIRLPELRRRALSARADAGTIALLDQHGRTYQPREYGEAPLAFRWVFLLAWFLTPAGVVLGLKRPWRMPPATTHVAPGRSEILVARTFAVSVAVAALGFAATLALATHWRTEWVSATEASRLLSERRHADLTLYEFTDGSKQLGWHPAGDHGTPRKARAEPALLATLASERIGYRRAVQGPDFTFADPAPGFSLVAIGFLAAAALALARWSLRVGALSAQHRAG